MKTWQWKRLAQEKGLPRNFTPSLMVPEKNWSQKKVLVPVPEKNGPGKKYRYRYRKNLVPEKSTGPGTGKNWSRKKVPVPVPEKILGTVTLWWWWWCVYAMRAVRTKRSFSFLIRALFFNMLCSGFNLTSMPLYRGLLQHHCPSQKTKGLRKRWLDIWVTVLSDGGKRSQRTFTETARALDGILGTLQGGENNHLDRY